MTAPNPLNDDVAARARAWRDGATIRHFWGSELLYAPTDPGQDMRHVGTLEPLWNLFDLTPEGRGTDWDEQLSYACCGSGPAV